MGARRQRSVTTLLGPLRVLVRMGQPKPERRSRRLDGGGQMAELLDRREMPGDAHDLCPDVLRQPCVPCQFDQKAARPYEGAGSFVRHSHVSSPDDKWIRGGGLSGKPYSFVIG